MYKVSVIDTASYDNVASVGSAYAGQVLGTALIAVNSLKKLIEIDNNGNVIEVVDYFSGLTVNQNIDDAFKKWNGSEWVDIVNATFDGGLKTPFGDNEVGLLILTGQSNMHSHGNTLSTADQITTPLNNVFVAIKAGNNNTTETEITFENYRTDVEHNVGKVVSNTYSFSYYYAKAWQAHIDAGNELNLPDLYITLVSQGA